MNKRKSILVTSGSKRLGKHISKFFVMNDWDLILHYNNSKVEAEETANELSLYSKNIKLYIYMYVHLFILHTVCMRIYTV